MIELIFILGFSLHNLEEALWLPKWSKYATKYHKEVSENEFRFAVMIITAIGYLLTFLYILFATVPICKYVFLGFVLMMVLNVIFPHLASSILLKKYAPGTITGILLNGPIGIYILSSKITNTNDLLYTILSSIIVTTFFLLLINMLFIIGSKLYD